MSLNQNRAKRFNICESTFYTPGLGREAMYSACNERTDRAKGGGGGWRRRAGEGLERCGCRLRLAGKFAITKT